MFTSKYDLETICTELRKDLSEKKDITDKDIKDITYKTMDWLNLTTAAKSVGNLNYLFKNDSGNESEKKEAKNMDTRYHDMPTSKKIQKNGFRIIFQSLSGLKEVIYEPFPQLEEEKN